MLTVIRNDGKDTQQSMEAFSGQRGLLGPIESIMVHVDGPSYRENRNIQLSINGGVCRRHTTVILSPSKARELANAILANLEEIDAQAQAG